MHSCRNGAKNRACRLHTCRFRFVNVETSKGSMMFFSRSITAVAAAFALTASTSACSQQVDNWPTKPITIIVPSTAGGTGDILTRIVAVGLEKQLKQAIIVFNKSGASGTIGMRAALLAPSDGYTFVVTGPSNIIASQFVMSDLPYVATRDFVSVGGIAAVELVVSTGSAIPSTSVQEFVKWGKANPEKLTYGSYGIGTYGHLVADRLAKVTQLQATHIPYRAEKEMLLGIATNEVAYGVNPLSTAKPMQDSGKTRFFALLAPRRSIFAPDVPTFKELGLDDPALALLAWNGLFASSKTPATIVRRMEAALVNVVNDEATKRRLIAASLVPWPANSKELDEVWKREIPIYKELANAVQPLAK
jgi:tripartite-type tricarboxylate transporter receptor subunit TctC